MRHVISSTTNGLQLNQSSSGRFHFLLLVIVVPVGGVLLITCLILLFVVIFQRRKSQTTTLVRGDSEELISLPELPALDESTLEVAINKLPSHIEILNMPVHPQRTQTTGFHSEFNYVEEKSEKHVHDFTTASLTENVQKK